MREERGSSRVVDVRPESRREPESAHEESAVPEAAAAWAVLRRSGRVRRVAPGETILREGEAPEGAYVLLAGRCSVIERGERVSSIGPGELFGEIATLGGGPRTATVVALEEGELLVLTTEQLQRSFEQSPELLWHSLAAIAARTRRIADREVAYREEHKALREAQLSLLPDLDALKTSGRLRCEALWQPCSYASGDYYDVVPIDSERFLFAIGDVMGPGAEASLMMAIARAQVRELARGFRRTDELLLHLDGYLRDHAPPRQGMSLMVAVLDLRRGVLEYSNAGHPPTLLLREGRVQELDAPGILLATPFLLGSGYARLELAVRSGDRLLFYTDGLFEVTSDAEGEGEPLGRRGLAELFAAVVRERPEAPLTELGRRVAAYDGAVRAQDDRTALLVAVG